MTEKEQLWYTRFLDYANSGISQHRWCREHGIAQSTFRYWCNKFRAFRIDDEPELPVEKPGQWYELSCRQETEMTCQVPTGMMSTIRLQFGDLKLEFPAETDPGTILQIAKGLTRS